MRTINLLMNNDPKSYWEDCLTLEAICLFPEDKKKELAYLERERLVYKFYYEELKNDHGNISKSVKDMKEIVGAFYSMGLQTEKTKKIEKDHKIIGYIMTSLLIDYCAYIRSYGSKPSLTKAFNTVLGVAISHEKETGIRTNINAAKLKNLWKNYKNVAHLIAAENSTKSQLKMSEITKEAIDYHQKRLKEWLLQSKMYYDLLKNIAAIQINDRNNKLPTVLSEDIYWFDSDLPNLGAHITISKMQEIMPEALILKVVEYHQKYRGSIFKGKKVFAKKLKNMTLETQNLKQLSLEKTREVLKLPE